MKRIFGLLFLFVTLNVSAIDINSKLSGIWYNANQSGHGLNVVVLDENTTVVYWYVYHTDGTPMFLITVGQNIGNRITGKTYYNTGMKFGDFDPNDIQETQWGTSTVTFSNCNSASLQYSSNVPGYGSGTIPMQRLASVAGMKCSDSPLHGTYHVTIADGATQQIGFGVGVLFDDGNMAYFALSSTAATVGLGQWRVTSNVTFAFDATSYSLEGGWEEISGTGTYGEDGLSADYTFGGMLIATPVVSFQRSLATSMLAGTYNISDPFDGVIGTVTISADGQASGSTFAGCNIDGGLWSANPNFNQVYVDVNVTNCLDAGRIVGAATFDHSNQLITVIASDGLTGYIWTLQH